MEDHGLPCLEMLEATPAILRALMCELSEDDARWKPAPDRFSVAEVLAHLSHTEGHCFRMRVDRFVSEERPEFEPDHAQLHLNRYRDADPEEEFAHFEEQRDTNLEYLRSLHAWALHDLGHIRQVAELARARRYQPGAGPLGKEYVLKP